MTIEWHLNVLMAQRRINNKELAEKTGMHPVTISKLKNSLEMPDRLEKNTLEKLCYSLDCQPGDLMEWDLDEVCELKYTKEIDDEDDEIGTKQDRGNGGKVKIKEISKQGRFKK